MIDANDLGFFGNIWVRQHLFAKAGDECVGHSHKHDHITLLVKGKVSVEVEGNPPKQFEGPTFIVIRKGMHHKFIAVTDDVLYYCVFALRDIDGSVIEIYEGRHDPMCAS